MKKEKVNKKVKRNSNKKTISYNDVIALPDGTRRLKILASYRQWVDLQTYFEDCFIEHKAISYRRIRPYIRASVEVKKALAEYFNRDPQEFMWHFYHYYILEANFINPLNKRAVKERGSKNLSDIKRIARHLYIFLKYWLKQPKHKHPALVKSFFEQNGIEQKKAIPATMKIIYEQCLNKQWYAYCDEKKFYDDYITVKGALPLTELEKAYQRIDYLPDRFPLSSLANK